MAERTCTIDDCDKPVCNVEHGWCDKHYHRWRRHGDPLVKLAAGVPTGYRQRPPEERFWAKINKAGPVPNHRPELGPCWLWTRATRNGGYGVFAFTATDLRPAHCFSYELHVGSIPPGLCVLHRCDNPPCVRPDHLFLGTKADNTADMIAKGRQRFWPRSDRERIE